MIIKTSDGKSINTDKDLTAPERHILQKLFAWEAMAKTISQFREKKKKALKDGWNHSGPVTASQAFKTICREMEKKVAARLRNG